ncbi:MAG: hypothetical protein LBQ15_03205 [Clostridium sp.]|nr:hypothetical protein [Clostridium sp.]
MAYSGEKGAACISPSSRAWELPENNYWSTGNGWYPPSAYSASLKGKEIPDWFLDDCLSALRIKELTELAGQMEGMVKKGIRRGHARNAGDSQTGAGS